jgi:hypothetical protein
LLTYAIKRSEFKKQSQDRGYALFRSALDIYTELQALEDSPEVNPRIISTLRTKIELDLREAISSGLSLDRWPEFVKRTEDMGFIEITEAGCLVWACKGRHHRKEAFHMLAEIAIAWRRAPQVEEKISKKWYLQKVRWQRLFKDQCYKLFTAPKLPAGELLDVTAKK